MLLVLSNTYKLSKLTQQYVNSWQASHFLHKVPCMYLITTYVINNYVFNYIII